MAKKEIQKKDSFEKYLLLIVPLLIVVVTLIVYNPSLNNSILQGWDDTEYLNNQQVTEFKVGEIFSDYHLGMYQPLSVITIAINFGSAGAEAPKAYHATNLFLHVLNILLVWLLLFRLTRRKLVAGIGTLFFALHPMNVEAISWISARSTLLFTAFYLAGLISYLKYTDSKKPLHFILTVLFALLALFSKSLAMSFPLALLVIDYFKDRGWNRHIWLEKIPFFALSIIFGIIAINAAGVYGHITELSHEYSLIDRFFILCHTFVFYLVKLFVPLELSPIYTYPDMSSGALPLMYYLSALIPIALLYFVYRFWKRQRQVISGILLFAVTISPVLPIFWSRVFVAADRYAYLSYIGLFLVLSILIDRLLKMEFFKNIYLKYAVLLLVLMYSAFWGYSARNQTKYWLETITLLSRAVDLSESSPAKAASHFYRANAYQNLAEKRHMEGQMAQDEKTVREAFFFYRYAIADYDSTLVHNPNYMLAYANRGMAYGTVAAYDTKYLTNAMEDIQQAIDIDPEYADNYYNLAWIYYMQQNMPKACELWKKADELGSVVAMQAIEQHCK